MTGLASDFGNAWRRFQAIHRVRPLQETVEWEWTRGRTDYIAFLIAISDDAVRQHIARAIELIAHIPGVEPFPERYWHITIKAVGFMTETGGRSDEVSPMDVQRLADEARPLLEATPQFQVRLSLPNAFPEVVFLEVDDLDVVRSLNTTFMNRLSGMPRYPVDGTVFLPHISIARFSSNDGLAELKETLSAMRGEQPGPSLTVREALLVQAHLADEAPQFDLLALYEFAR